MMKALLTTVATISGIGIATVIAVGGLFFKIAEKTCKQYAPKA